MSEPAVDVGALREVVAAATGDADVRLGDLTMLTGGASRHTHRFTTLGSDGSRRTLILQIQAPGGLDVPDERPAGFEAAVLRAAAESGVPVPALLASSADEAPLGAPFLLSEHVDGETIARRILRDDAYATARSEFVAQCGAALAAVHRIDPTSVPLIDGDPLERYRAGLDEVGLAIPTFELAFRWLERHRPAPGPSVVVHGDFRLGNLIVDAEGLAAVLDWELAHIGSAGTDLAWLSVRAWRFGGAKPVAGLGEREELIDAYRSAGGASITVEELRWHEVAGTLKWGIMCGMQAHRHVSGASPSHELAAIGRRIVENEWDVLELIG